MIDGTSSDDFTLGAMLLRQRGRIGNYLRTRSGFMRASTAFWGGSMAVLELWSLVSHGMVLLAFLIVPVCFGVGWVFA
jgi:hypothetical protein